VVACKIDDQILQNLTVVEMASKQWLLQETAP
jgi:hypothetical protein